MQKLSSSQIRSIVSQYQNSGDQNLMLPVIHTLSDMIDELSRRYPTQAGAVETSDLVLEGQMAVITLLYGLDDHKPLTEADKTFTAQQTRKVTKQVTLA